MRVNLQDRDRPACKAAIGFQHRNRHRIIAAKNKGRRAGIQHGGDGLADKAAVSGGDFGRGVGDNIQIAKIGGPHTRRDHAG
jgi:hypothetical protein